MKKYSTALICTMLIIAWMIYVKNLDYVTNAFLVLMVVILFAEGVLARTKLLNITESIQKATEEYLYSKKVTYNTIIYNKSIEFEDDFLNNLYASYVEDVRKASTENDRYYYDVADYINQERIFKYIHKDITDQVSNTMTGLGILGTFVGLIVGLTHFNTSSTQEITNGIENLLDGIKTAFHTSIGGVCISLIYNYFYYRDLENNSKAIEEFCSAFYKNVMPAPEHQLLSDILNCQHEQTKCLEALAGSIAGELAPRFAEEMGKTVTPVMERLNHSIDDYIIKAVDAQSETLGNIVNKFMMQLNKSLDDQFLNLSKSIKEMCQWQSDGAENIRVIIASLGEMAKDIKALSHTLTSNSDIQKGINETSEELFEKTKRYVNSLSEFKDAVEKQTRSTLEHHGNIEEILHKNIESNNSVNNNILALTNGINDYIAKNSEMIDEYSKRADEMSEYSKQTIDRLSTVGEFMDTLAETKAGINSIKECCERFIAEIDKLVENANNSTDVVSKGIQNINNEISKINKNKDAYEGLKNLKEIIERMEYVQQRIATVLGDINQTYSEKNIRRRWLERVKRTEETKDVVEE